MRVNSKDNKDNPDEHGERKKPGNRSSRTSDGPLSQYAMDDHWKLQDGGLTVNEIQIGMSRPS